MQLRMHYKKNVIIRQSFFKMGVSTLFDFRRDDGSFNIFLVRVS